MKSVRLLVAVFLSLVFVGTTMAQGIVKGVVKDAANHESLVGATVVVEGTTIGVTTSLDGSFSFKVPEGAQQLKISYVGYESLTKTINVAKNQTINLGTINIASSAIGLHEVNVLANMAVSRKTPVAVSTLNSQTIEDNLGNQEFPEVMNTTPDVYATKSGGGYGDAQVNIRGFDQRNIAFLINGIPVNDMENGWMYWSDWAGLADVTRTIQIQRGLGASKLAINSVGGTVNIVTKTTDMQKGGSLTMSMTDYGQYKEMLTLSTGRLKTGTAITFSGSHTEGPGYIDATWVKAWSYFFSVSQELGKNNQLVFTIFGAPQQHGQRTHMLTQAQFDKYGPKYNSNWGWLGGKMLNEVVNYYDKPQMALNWYSKLSDKAQLATSVYYSFGTGGGSGPLGTYDVVNDYGQYNWDAMVATNAANVNTDHTTAAEAQSTHIIRNSVNNHQWFGVLSTLTDKLSEPLTLTAGVDFRHYKGEHYREVRDLLGGDYYYDKVYGVSTVGNKIAYWDDGHVTYGGLFAQLEYSKGAFDAFVAGTASNTWAYRVDHYSYYPAQTAAVSPKVSMAGYNFKLGGNYNISPRSNFFINAGYYSRVPFFEYMYLNYVNDLNTNLKNETVTAGEIGYNYIAPRFTFKANAYYTVWGHINMIASYYDNNNVQQNAYLSDLKQINSGLELEAHYDVTNWMNLGGMANFGHWMYANDVSATQYNDQTHTETGTAYLYTKNLRVGQQPQTSYGLFGKFKVAKKLDFGLNYLYYANLYADLSPQYRTNPANTAQAYKLPNYGLVNVRLGWRFKLAGMDSYFNWNVYNLMNKITLVEANDQFNSTSGTNVFRQGYWSWGRNMNFSLKVNF
ncbi:MAG: TonB-dependent receptor [Bacteroidales bacterium]|nr:TonB-dependent receptor [Bacteroidales bacterium]